MQYCGRLTGFHSSFILKVRFGLETWVWIPNCTIFNPKKYETFRRLEYIFIKKSENTGNVTCRRAKSYIYSYSKFFIECVTFPFVGDFHLRLECGKSPPPSPSPPPPPHQPLNSDTKFHFRLGRVGGDHSATKSWGGADWDHQLNMPWCHTCNLMFRKKMFYPESLFKREC